MAENSTTTTGYQAPQNAANPFAYQNTGVGSQLQESPQLDLARDDPNADQEAPYLNEQNQPPVEQPGQAAPQPAGDYNAPGSTPPPPPPAPPVGGDSYNQPPSGPSNSKLFWVAGISAAVLIVAGVAAWYLFFASPETEDVTTPVDTGVDVDNETDDEFGFLDEETPTETEDDATTDETDTDTGTTTTEPDAPTSSDEDGTTSGSGTTNSGTATDTGTEEPVELSETGGDPYATPPPGARSR